MSDPDPEELLQSSKTESRLTSDPKTDSNDRPVDLEGAIVDVFEELDAGDRSPNLTVRDENLAALIGGLETTGGLAALSEAAREHLGRDDSPGDPEARATALRLLLRVGLAEVAPERLDTLQAARKEFVASQVDDI